MASTMRDTTDEILTPIAHYAKAPDVTIGLIHAEMVAGKAYEP